MFTAVHVCLITLSLIIGKTKVSVKVSVSAIHLTGSIGIGIANTFLVNIGIAIGDTFTKYR